MTDELRAALERAAGSPGDRPDLGGLWSTGRRRRRRTRLATTAVAVVALVGLAVGAVALAGGDDDGQDVVAGPLDRPADAPPAEPTEGFVVIEDVDAGPVVDGVPTPEPGEVMTLTYAGMSFGRSALAEWERWDGEAWVGEHVLVVERAGQPGSGQVLDPDVSVDTGEFRFTEEVDRYPTPEDLVAGWYRVCVTMMIYSGVGPTVPAGETIPPPDGEAEGAAEPAYSVEEQATTTTDPTSTTEPIDPQEEPGLGEQIRPCAQLRLPGESTAPTDPTSTSTTAPGGDGPPPAEPTSDEIVLSTVGEPPYPDGGSIALQVRREGGITLGFETTWEQWVGTEWVRTHVVDGAPYDGVEPGLRPSTDEVVVADGAVSFPDGLASLVIVIPPVWELTSQWSRICIDPEPASLGRPCIQVAIDGAGGQPVTVHGDDATWAIDPEAPPTPEATSVTILVTRSTCSGGVTGELLEPRVVIRPTEVFITVDAVPVGSGTCPGNDAVPLTVDLGEPLGDRTLIDGWCAGSDSPNACFDGGEVRWTP